MALEKRLAHWVRRHRLLAPGDRVGVAVSGGSDSIALLRLLHQQADAWGLQLAVAHFDHAWRADSADDAGFVAALAEQLGLPFYSERAPLGVSGPASADAEQYARRQRYGFFQKLVAAGHVRRIATAHTLDDQAETVLLRLLRGSGPAGLAGVLPARGFGDAPGQIIRPLLWARRAELRAWLEALGQSWREDPTNASRDRRRNWIRHELLPLMHTANPALIDRLGGLAEIVRAEEAYWSEHVALMSQRVWTPTPHGIAANTTELAGLPLALQRRLLRHGIQRTQGDLRRVDFAAVEAVVEAIASPTSRPRQFSCGSVRCRLDGCHIELSLAVKI